MERDSKIFLCGHRGMVGSACLRKLQAEGFTNLLLRTHAELDLRNQQAVRQFFDEERPEYVILAAAKVGGILANQKNNAEFLLENLEIQNNVIWQSFQHGVKKFCFLGSSCIYPRLAPQPIREDALLTGPLEPTNEGYALAKIAGYKLCLFLSRQYGWNTISLMPCNLYGTNDNYEPNGSHVFPALIRRFVLAAKENKPEETLWGTGRPLREFLHVDDLANAVFHFMEHHNEPTFVNVGSGSEISIAELAALIAREAGFHGKINWDSSKPDGMPRKLMDSSKANKLGWTPKISLEEGIRRTIQEFRSR